MSLSEVKLDPYLLAKMYTQPIIPEEKQAGPAVQKELPKVKYLGENQKNILLLIQNENEAYLNDESFNLLANILNACKLGMQDVALANITQYTALTMAEWQQVVNFNRCVVFGIGPDQLGVEAPVYQLVTIGGTTALFSHDLGLIGSDKQLKGRLWMGLQKLFNLV
ncbi:hypothetical protein MKQ70_34975 [Chitinophaga sedimenti]|uniref:hypothetical protein n=1 Tax=Chitinophaga sedimenti TaxID=2033606 RepID=UPI0020055CE9|nr:hypothetical protein [Chitinophaga sedimenti]MCK7559864.1 hypothetical protein [Chitinophaga sedimenti]